MDEDNESALGPAPLSDSLRYVLEAAGIGWWDLDIVANTTARSLLHDRAFGYDEMLASWSYDDYLAHVHVDDRAMVAEAFETALAGGDPYAVDVRVVWPDGTLHWLFTRGRFLRDEEGNAYRVAGVVGDITARKMAEIADAEARASAAQSAAQNLALLETLLGSAPIGFAYVDREFRYVRINDLLAEINGVPAEDTRGRTAKHLLPDLWPQLEPILQRVKDRRVAVLDVAIAGETAARPGVRREWVASYYPVLIDDAIEISGIGIVVKEVTEQRHMEAQLHQAQKLEAVGLLAGGLAHNFNNVLGVITLAAEHAATRDVDDAVGAELDRILTVARSSSGLTRQLLQFSRTHPVTPALVDASACVQSVAAFLAPTLGDHIIATTDTQSVATISIDRTQLEQLLVNLAINARDAMPDGGELIFRTNDITIDHATSHLQPGQYVEVCVQDDGAGMSPEVLEHAFEPFFTTKAGTGGSGLGLATVHGIATAANGDVRIDSTPGTGTTISVRFPVVHEPVEALEAPGDVIDTAFPGRRVLVVDDEVELRTLVELILRGAGYEVHGGTAQEVAEYWRGADLEPDLLITDMSMPGMSGPELARILSDRWPKLNVLYMSGYGGANLDALGSGTTPTSPTILSKPFASTELLRAVALALQPADSTHR